jgi:hypothetical protein
MPAEVFGAAVNAKVSNPHSSRTTSVDLGKPLKCGGSASLSERPSHFGRSSGRFLARTWIVQTCSRSAPMAMAGRSAGFLVHE